VSGHVHDEWANYVPEVRCSGCGHRVRRLEGDPPPRATRRSGWRMIVAEYPMRWVARQARIRRVVP
jgi:hypothetical protein